MMLGIGTDLVDIRRIEKALARQPQRFMTRLFTPHEISQALRAEQGEAGERKKISSLAKRFAAKEAVLKALGLGFREGIRWRDIEVRNDMYGAPILKLYGKAKDIAASRVPEGMQLRHHISLTDEYPYAQAFVVLEAR